MSARKIIVAWCAFFALSTAAQLGLGALTAVVATTLLARSGQHITPADVQSLSQWVKVGSWVVTAALSLAFYYWSVRKLAIGRGPASP